MTTYVNMPVAQGYVTALGATFTRIIKLVLAITSLILSRVLDGS